MPLEVKTSQEVPEASPIEPARDTSHAFSTPYYTHRAFFKRSKNVLQEGLWPKDMVIAGYGDACVSMLETLADLSALISFSRKDYT